MRKTILMFFILMLISELYAREIAPGIPLSGKALEELNRPLPPTIHIDYKRIKKELGEINLKKELIRDTTAANELQEIAKRSDKEYGKCLAGYPNSFKMEEFEDLKSIIDKYPGTTSALTAYLRIAILLGTDGYSSDDHAINPPENEQKIEDQPLEERRIRGFKILGRNIFEEIIKKYPGTWQSRISIWCIYIIKQYPLGWSDVSKSPKAKEIRVKLLKYLESNKNELLLVDDEKDPECIMTKKRIFNFHSDEMSPAVYNNIADFYEMFGDDDKAAEMCELVIKNYQNSIATAGAIDRKWDIKIKKTTDKNKRLEYLIQRDKERNEQELKVWRQKGLIK